LRSKKIDPCTRKKVKKRRRAVAYGKEVKKTGIAATRPNGRGLALQDLGNTRSPPGPITERKKIRSCRLSHYQEGIDLKLWGNESISQLISKFVERYGAINGTQWRVACGGGKGARGFSILLMSRLPRSETAGGPQKEGLLKDCSTEAERRGGTKRRRK